MLLWFGGGRGRGIVSLLLLFLFVLLFLSRIFVIFTWQANQQRQFCHVPEYSSGGFQAVPFQLDRLPTRDRKMHCHRTMNELRPDVHNMNTVCLI